MGFVSNKVVYFLNRKFSSAKSSKTNKIRDKLPSIQQKCIESVLKRCVPFSKGAGQTATLI